MALSSKELNELEGFVALQNNELISDIVNNEQAIELIKEVSQHRNNPYNFDTDQEVLDAAARIVQNKKDNEFNEEHNERVARALEFTKKPFVCQSIIEVIHGEEAYNPAGRSWAKVTRLQNFLDRLPVNAKVEISIKVLRP